MKPNHRAASKLVERLECLERASSVPFITAFGSVIPALGHLGVGTISRTDFSVGSLIVSFLGAIILLAIVNFFRRRRHHA